MAGRHDQDHLVAEERLEDDTPVTRGGTDDAELEFALGDLLDHAVRVRDRERDAQLRMLALELPEQDWHDRSARPRRGAERQLAAQHSDGVRARDLLEQLVLQSEHPLRQAVEALAGLGRLHAPPRAVEQLCSQPLLERANLEADRRLRDAEAFGGVGEALPLYHLAEGGELSRVHKQLL